MLTRLLSHPSPLVAATAAQPLRNLLHRGEFYPSSFLSTLYLFHSLVFRLVNFYFCNVDSCSEFSENQIVFCHAGGVKMIKEILSVFPPPSDELLQAIGSILHVLSIHNEIIRRITNTILLGSCFLLGFFFF